VRRRRTGKLCVLMTQRVIYATKYDFDRLTELIKSRAHHAKDADRLQQLGAELGRASIVWPVDVPADVVTMNSRVRLTDLDDGGEVTYTLVFPDDANIDENKISVLAPIGTAILGYRAGETVQWEVPAGTRRLRIDGVLYQPEAAGHFHL